MSVFSDLKPTNHAKRNGFDLSRYSSFSAKVGPIYPVFSQLTLQGGDYSIDVKQLLRTQPLNTAAFAGFSLNYDVVFTPLNHLYSSFNQFIAQRANYNSAVQPTNQTIPLFDLESFVYNTVVAAVWDYMTSFYNEVDFKSQDQTLANFPYFLVKSQHDPSQSVCLDVIRSLDLFGYGNYLPLVKQFYKAVVKKIEVDYNVTIDGVDSFSIAIGDIFDAQTSNYFRWSVWNSFVSSAVDTYMTSSGIQAILGNINGKNVTLWPVLAYNKAFHEYYRNTYYDSAFYVYLYEGTTVQINRQFQYVNLFNFDDWSTDYTNPLDFDDVEFARLLSMFALKPHLYKKDLFTGILPSTQFGDVSVMVDDSIRQLRLVLTNGQEQDLLFGTALNSSVSSTRPVLQLNQQGIGNVPTPPNFVFDPSIAISVLESRRADAMQRFRERMLRAGDKTKDIFKAHGWTEPKSEKSWEPIFLGSFDGRLDINTVAATSESGDFNVGQLAANGVGTVSGKTIDFKNTDFGIIQIFFYLTKDAVYNSYGLDAQHTLTEAFDWPYPELQNISLAPITKSQLSVAPNLDDIQTADSNDILGYLPRFMPFKTAVDLVHGEFYAAYPLDALSQFNGGVTDAPQAFDGIFASWVTPRQDVNNAKDLSFLYISPSCADNIFAVNANARQDTDQFIVNAYFKCMCIEPLTVIGLPI